jgi:exodeoxyribonuclease III
MKVATFNINGINQRLNVLISWLLEKSPDIVCLQELKAADNRFPVKAVRDAGYGAIWQGQTSWNGVAILAKGADPNETRRGLPGGESDPQCRYIEAAVNGILIGCLYLPNGNPQPGPKFAYKLAWFERLNAYAASLLASKHPVALCGDYNVMPTDFDIYDTVMEEKRPVAARKPRCLRETFEPRVDGRLTDLVPRGADLHFLGLLSQPLAEELRVADRPSFAERLAQEAARECRCRSGGARCGACQ